MPVEKRKSETLKSDANELSEAKRNLLAQRLRGVSSSRPEAERIQPRPAGARTPVSADQYRIWLHASAQPDLPTYNEPITIEYRGNLDVDLLEKALNRFLQRHESWRTSFVIDQEDVLQVVHSDLQVKLERVDLSDLPELEREAEAKRLATEQAVRPISLTEAPLLRPLAVRLAVDDYRLYIVLHHIIFDGISIQQTFLPELAAIYTALESGSEPILPEQRLQYCDYAFWRQQQLDSAAMKSHVDYWRTALAGELPILRLPTDRPRPAVISQRGGMERFLVARELTNSLRELGQAHGATLYMTLLAAFKVLLFRYGGEEDILVGGAADARRRPELQGMMGYILDTFAVRTRPSPKLPFSEYLNQVKNAVLGALDAADVPFERVVQAAGIKRDLSYHPIFQACFSLQPNAGAYPPGWDTRPMDVTVGATKFDIYFEVDERPSYTAARITYSTDLFDADTIRRMSGHWLSLLESIRNSPDCPLGDLPLLTAAERHRLLYEWNNTKAEFPSHRCIHELFEEQVRKTPDATAVVFEEESLSYQELNRRANQLAHYLRGLGVMPDTHVALCIERSLEMIVGLLAVLKAGGAYVPLDPAYPADRLNFMLEDSAPIALLTQTHLHEIFSGMSGMPPVLDLDAVAPPWADQTTDQAMDQPYVNPDPASIGLTPQHLAYIIYTSGSTGTPKGVMVEHRGLCNRIVWMQRTYGLDSEDAVLQKTPFSFDVSVWEFFWPIVAGAKLVMARPEGHKDPTYLYQAIQRNQITTVHFVPSMLGIFLEQDGAAACSSLRDVICSGEALPGLFVRRFQERLPKAALHNLYGPTEATVDVTAWTCPPGWSQDSIPIGRPIANTQIYILDGNGQPVPVGVAGEMYIGGVQVARGYLNRPQLTAERFLPDPFSSEPDARMYKTGDLVRWLADGNIEFLGRNDFQIKLRGFRIELGEIEARLAEYPGVGQTIVIAREDRLGDKRLVAYYTLADTAPIGAEQLRSHLSASLPEYMVPAALVHLEELPVTPNGKLDRKALPAPDGDAYSTRGYEAPEGESETALAEIWAEVLKLDRVGRRDNFFELGGHSLLAVTLIERMRRRGLHLDVRSLFAAPTLAELAATVGDEDRRVEVAPNRIPLQCEVISPEMLPLIELTTEEIERIVGAIPGGAANVQDIYPLAPLQEGILFHHLLATEGDPYLLATQLTFDTREGLDKYLGALQAIVSRHDILRTAVIWEGLHEPAQVVLRAARLPIQEVNLTPADGDIAEQLYARFDPRHYRIDIRQAPLLRIAVAHDKNNNGWIAMLLQHHLAGDHTTLEIMQEEIQSHLLGNADQLTAPLPFRNLVAQARMGAGREGHEAFFRQMLGDIDEPTAPFELLDVQGGDGDIKEARTLLDDFMSRRIRASARKLQVSAASLCHLAWALVLAETTGRKDVVFGTVLFGRMLGDAGSDRVMGMFINTLPVRISIDQQGVEQSVRRTHVLLADLMRHEYAPLALAQRCSAVPAPAPLFSTLLNYRHNPAVAQTPSPEALQAWRGMRWLRGEERTNYPLVLSVEDFGEQLGLTAQTLKSIGPERICEFMRTALESLVDALETAPTRAVHALQVLPEAERHRVLHEWNDIRTDLPSYRCIHELFEEQVRKTPDATAVVFEEASLSYQELNRRANQLAHYLRGLGVRPDTHVALCVERSLEMIVGLLAVLKAGGAYVPLDPAYPADRLNFMLEDSAPIALLTQTHLHEIFSGMSGMPPVLDLDAVAPPWMEKATDQSQANPDPASVGLTPQHLAYIIYTSGSTGTPKGVMVEHRNVSRLFTATAEWFKFDETDVWTLFHSYAFDFSVWEIWGALCHGGRLIVVPKNTTRSPEDFYSLICQAKVTILNQTPSAFRQLITAQSASKKSHRLRHVIFGGEALEVSILKPWYEQNSGRLPRLINMYGITETTVHVTYRPLEPADTTRHGASPIGCRIPDLRIYILDAHGAPVPVGVTGELYVGGAGVARGYLNRPELTAARFLPDPFSGEALARMYRTGDLGRWLPDGNIEFLGRNDFQVKIRGFRVELGEIEACLAEYPGIRDAIIIAREDTPGDKRLVAYYTAADTDIGADALRAYLAEKLPDYMIPSAYMRLESLPLTPNGKLDRQALPAPDSSSSRMVSNLPTTSEERRLAKIWAEVLGVDYVSRSDNFFDLGGHSLLLVRLFGRLNREFKSNLPITTIFDTPTLSALAKVLQDKMRVSSLVPVQTSGSKPPLFMVHSYLLYHALSGALGNDQPFYGLRELPEDEKESIEERALRYVADLRRVQQGGAYRIAGWCAAGPLAVEIARQLILAGDEVARIVLFDSWLPGYVENLKSMETRQPYIKLLTSKLAYHKNKLDGLSLAGGMKYFWGAFRRMNITARDQFYVRYWSAMTGLSKRLNIPLPEFMHNTTLQTFASMREFRVENLPVHITLIRAIDSREVAGASASYGWEKIAELGVTVLSAPGDHETMFHGANLAVTASMVRDALSECTTPEHDTDFRPDAGSRTLSELM